MTTPVDLPLLRQIADAVRTVRDRIEDQAQVEDPLIADAVLWRISLIAQAADRLSPELISRHPLVDWSGVRRLHLIAEGTLGGMTRDEVWQTAAAVLPPLGEAVDAELSTQTTSASTEVHRILLVDDDPDIRRILDMLLTHAGFSVVEASDGVEALQRARETRPDAVVADIQMPNMDGVELVHQLHALPELGRVPVLLFTGKPPVGDLREVLSRDRVRYMSKGDPRKVIEALQAMFAEAIPAG